MKYKRVHAYGAVRYPIGHETLLLSLMIKGERGTDQRDSGAARGEEGDSCWDTLSGAEDARALPAGRWRRGTPGSEASLSETVLGKLEK